MSPLNNRLAHEFSIKDLVSYNFSLALKQSHNLWDSNYAKLGTSRTYLNRLEYLNRKPVTTPMATKIQASNLGGEAFSDPTRYRSIVGALQCITLTCPDIAFAVNRACQFMHSPTELHWYMVKCIIRYLKHTASHNLLLYKSSSSTLQAFIDAEWA